MFNREDSFLYKFIAILKQFWWRLRNEKLKVFLSGFLGIVGFLLSPLSWWNDLVINVPLAWLFAYAVSKPLSVIFPISKTIFTGLFGAGYLLTNLLGFVLLHLSIVHATGAETISHRKQLIITLLYTAVFLALLYFDVIKLVIPGISFIPSFIR